MNNNDNNGIYQQVIGKTVAIGGHVGGSIRIDEQGAVKTGHKEYRHPQQQHATRFVVEPSPVQGNRPMVTFRMDGTNLFLTQNPYGDEARAQIARAMAAEDLPLPVEVLCLIIDLAAQPGTLEGNFEGQGFDYTPMTAVLGPPGMLQSFSLEGDDLGTVGVSSPFGKYWRSQHWTNTVSQSSHWERDETWSFEVVVSENHQRDESVGSPTAEPPKRQSRRRFRRARRPRR